MCQISGLSCELTEDLFREHHTAIVEIPNAVDSSPIHTHTHTANRLFDETDHTICIVGRYCYCVYEGRARCSSTRIARSFGSFNYIFTLFCAMPISEGVHYDLFRRPTKLAIVINRWMHGNGVFVYSFRWSEIWYSDDHFSFHSRCVFVQWKRRRQFRLMFTSMIVRFSRFVKMSRVFSSHITPIE